MARRWPCSAISVPADLFNNKMPARRELRALVVDDILRRRI
jgi:hypothetical protein